MKIQVRFLLFGLVMLFIGGCATAPPRSIPTGDPAQLVVRLESDLNSARSKQVDVLAPGLYNEAQTAYMKAREALQKGARLSAISDYVAEGYARLKKAEEIAQVSRTILADANAARAKALKAGADKLGEPFIKVEKQYEELTRAIENDNLSYAQKNADKVQSAFRKIEISAIKNNALGDAREMMAAAEKAKLQKIAPAAYNDALQALNTADAYIDQNPYAAETIDRKAAQAEFMARRLMAISESSKKFQGLEPEAAALYVESLMMRLSRALNSGDLRDKTVEGQVATLTGAAEAIEQNKRSLEARNQTYHKKITDLEQRLAALQGLSREQELARRKLASEQETASQKLAAEREFNERFNEVQRYFHPDEAEVYRQGNQLVIRLRGIQFPVGRATLTPENYILLSKVQKAIQTFGQPRVTIEGHTDSTGSAEKNLELSQERADAVKTYLLANKTVPDNRISARGYGSQRPLAPNTTSEGRAVNRRIDVLITPAQTP